MKKILISFFALAFLLGAVSVMAKAEKNNEDFSKPLKVSNFKIEKKQILSKEDRLLADEAVKGGKLGFAKGKTSPTISGATGILGTQVTDSAKKYAIVIGLSNYAGTINDLCVTKTDQATGTNCADGDSLNMKQALKDEYGYLDANIHIFRDADANFSAIQSAAASIVSSAGSDSEIVFFFSGHSATSKADIFQNRDSMNVGLALYGASGGSEIIWDGQLKQWFETAQTSRVVFIFDTCHAGGLSSYLQKDGREVVMSSAENQYSYTYSLGGPSGPGEGMFTHYFAKIGMIGGQADGFNALKSSSTDPKKYDGNVAVEEAFQFSKTYVPAATRNRQVPALNDKFANDLLL